MGNIVEKIKEYNHLTKLFMAISVFGLLYSFLIFKVLFTLCIFWTGAYSIYAMISLFCYKKNKGKEIAILSQESYDKGKNNFEIFFACSLIIAISTLSIFSTLFLIAFIIAKSIFINNEDFLNKIDN